MNRTNVAIKNKRAAQNITNEEFYMRTFALSAPISTIFAGITYPIPPYEIMRKNADCYSIEYIYDGEGFVHHGDDIFRAQKGDMLILHPHVYHHYYSNEKNPWHKVWFSIDGSLDFITSLIKTYHLENTVLIKNVNNPFQLEKIFAESKKEQSSSKTLSLLVHQHLAEIAEYQAVSTSSIMLAEQLRRYIENKANTHIDIAELCKFTNLGRSYIIKSFSEAFGMTPIAYHIDFKMKLAKKQLETSSVSLKEISESLGYSDYNHFLKTFKNHTGISPTEYRNQLNQT